MISLARTGRRAAIMVRLFTRGDWRLLAYKLQIRVRGLDLRPASLEELGLSPEHSVEHWNSGGPGLESLLRELEIRPADAILDFGSGKGGALLTMARLPFRRISGVDISPQMTQIASRNVARLGLKNISIFRADAEQFTEIDFYNYLYFYNPFPASVMRAVMTNVGASLARQPRDLTLIYTFCGTRPGHPLSREKEQAIRSGGLFELLFTREIPQDGCRWVYHVFRHCRQTPMPGAS